MATDTQVTTLSDMQTDLLNRVRHATGVSATNTIASRYLNIALMDMHIDPGNYLPWAERRAILITHAPYTTGTVAITAAARTTVTGASTLWNTAVTGFGFNNARVGGKMTFSGITEVSEVSSVDSDTQITLANRYTGAALSGASYTYFEDEYALASDFLRSSDWRSFSTESEIRLIGPKEFRRLYPRNSTTGKPRVATVIQLGFSANTTPRPRVALHPAPDDEYAIPYTYLTTNLAVSSAGAEQAQMTASTDEPIVPLRYRHLIVFHALYHWYRDLKDDQRSQEAKSEYVDLMQRVKGDASLGNDRDRARLQPSYGRYLGTARRRGRYSADSRFDELKDR